MEALIVFNDLTDDIFETVYTPDKGNIEYTGEFLKHLITTYPYKGQKLDIENFIKILTLNGYQEDYELDYPDEDEIEEGTILPNKYVYTVDIKGINTTLTAYCIDNIKFPALSELNNYKKIFSTTYKNFK